MKKYLSILVASFVLLSFSIADAAAPLMGQNVVYRGTATGLRISSVDGTAFLDALPAAVYDVHNSVTMTYAASGSSGITVADDADIDFGTGNFTLVWRGSLPDWTPAQATYFFSKRQDSNNRVQLTLEPTGVFTFAILKGGSVVGADGTVANTITDGAEAEIACVVERESAGAAGSAKIYVKGALHDTIVLAAAAPIDASNTGNLQIMGQNESRHAGTTLRALAYNRALTAAEVLSLYNTGIAAADKWGSQTSLVTNGTMEVDANWSAKGTATSVRSNEQAHAGTYSRKISTSAQYAGVNSDSFTTVTGCKYSGSIWIYTATNPDYISVYMRNGANENYTNLTPAGIIGTAGWTEYTFSYTESNGGPGAYISFQAGSSDSHIFYIDDVVLTKLGSTLALESSGIKQAGWDDFSDNNLDGVYPAAYTLNPTYLDGQHQLEIYDSTGKVLKGVLKAAGSAETLDSEIISTWTNNGTYPWETFTVDGVNFTQLVNNVGGYGFCSTPFSAATGGLYKAVATTTLTGTAKPRLWFGSSVLADAPQKNFGELSDGANTFYHTAPANYTHIVFEGQVSANTTDFASTNTVKKVLTPSTSGATIVSAAQGTTYNFATKTTGFAYNEASYVVIVKKLRGAALVASGSITAGSALMDLTTANAFAAPVGVDLSAYQDGNHILRLFNASGVLYAEAFISATAPAGETLDSEIISVEADRTFASDTGWWTKNANTTIADGVCKAAAVAGTGGIIYKLDILTTSALYKPVFDVVAGSYSAGGVRVFIAGQYGTTRNTEATFTQYVTSGTDGDVSYEAVGTTTLNLDNLSLKRVTDPASTGALLLSSKAGSRGYVYKHASLTGNEALTYQVLKVQ